jgi:DNA-binding transcriptional MerR regulator
MTPEKYSIGDVSRLIGVKPYVIRYWEDEIPFIAPRKGVSGRREYSERDVQALIRVKHLLYEQKYTIEGARQRIWSELQAPQADMKARIAEIRSDLLAVWAKVQGWRDSE